MTLKKHEVRLLPIAESDLNDIVAFVAEHNHAAAIQLMDRIEDGLDSLALNPHLGKASQQNPLDSMGYRYLVIQNYLVFYVLRDNVILIHRILHGARNYLDLF